LSESTPVAANTDRTDRPKAVLVAVHFPRQPDHEFTSSLDELERLVTTLGYKVVERVTQPRAHVEHTACNTPNSPMCAKFAWQEARHFRFASACAGLLAPNLMTHEIF